MQFRTMVEVGKTAFKIEPGERMLFVGSCFADNIGCRFKEEKFRAEVNPFGVMYNPASILHTIKRYGGSAPRVAVMTLGTNHVYILKETGEIVDNCQKRPQALFREEELSADECFGYLSQAVELLLSRRSDTKVVVTVSPIRYAKYGFHGSALSKATLLIAADRLEKQYKGIVEYFPAYEIVNDELRDYRFYAPDMLHPSEQAVEYIWDKFSDAYFSESAKKFILEWKPVKAAFNHRPFNPDSAEYKAFIAKAKERKAELEKKYSLDD